MPTRRAGLALALAALTACAAGCVARHRACAPPELSRASGRVQLGPGDDSQALETDLIRSLADKETAAIMLEPIQSMAGVAEASPEFFRELREICDQNGIVLIFDEVQTGVGRTGNWFFSGSDLAGAVEADIITLAKSLGSGLPVGACLVNEKISARIKTNDLGTTFGGGMLAMAAVLATLEAVEKDDMLENAKRIEDHLRGRLEKIPDVVNLRGKGCLLGIEFNQNCQSIHQKLLENKIITGTSSHPNVLRLLPPLCVTSAEVDLLVEILDTK